MTDFTLEEYIKNPSRKVITKGGKPVKVITTEGEQDWQPIEVEIDLGEGCVVAEKYTTDGKTNFENDTIWELAFED